jgi:type I restriction enzyme R subunit
VKGGYLVNPVVTDARTEITTQLLSEKGYAVAAAKSSDNGDESGAADTADIIEEIFVHRDFEKKFFSENTNAAFCKAFLAHALPDPISGEIGKTIVFCVSQHHASKITQLLNMYGDKMFPGKYHSDFALQVTSSVPDAQEFTKQFANNNLLGRGNFNEAYGTSKTRVCVTVGMMTTGYDCPDILNLCLMRPFFSPSEFIQIKGRGTRRHNFTEEVTDRQLRNRLGEQQKTRYKLFDFFANCEYFEEKFNYDEQLKLPRNNDGGLAETTWDPQKTLSSYTSTCDDEMLTIAETAIGAEGMKIDRMYFERFEDLMQREIAARAELKAKVERGQWDEVMAYVEQHLFDRPEDFFTLEKLRRAARVDRRITFIEILQKALGHIPYFPSRDELLNEEFDRFYGRFLPDEAYFDACKTMFTAYVNDLDFRATLDSGNYALLNVSAYGEAFRKLTPDLRKQIPEYIKDYVPLNVFAA